MAKKLPLPKASLPLPTEEDDYDLSYPGLVHGKDEMNLAEFPFALLRRQGDSREAFTYEGRVVDKEGKWRRQKWTVRGATGLGLPNEYDERVMVALMAISAADGFQNRKVPFSVYRLLQVMRLSDSKRDYKNIERSLARLNGASITAEGAFWDNAEKAFSSQVGGFHLISNYWLAYLEEDDTVREREGVPAYFIWDEILWKSIRDGYIKSLDLDIYYTLQTRVRPKLYRLLDKRLYKNSYFEIDVFELGARLGLAAYKYPSQILDKMQAAVEELLSIKFLSGAGVKKHGKYTRAWFERQGGPPLPGSGAGARPGQGAEVAENLASVVLDMLEFGISQEVAQSLARTHAEDYIQRKVDYLRVQLKRKRHSIRNPSGWLRRAIEEDFTPPTPQGTQLIFDTPAVEPAATPEEGHGIATDAVFIEDPDSGFLRTTWLTVLGELRLQNSRATFDQMLAATKLFALDGRTATILAPNARVAEVLEHRLYQRVSDAVARVIGRSVVLRFVVDGA